MTEQTERVYYSCMVEPEILDCTSISEAVEEWRDQIDGEIEPGEIIPVGEYRPMPLPTVDRIANYALEHTLEYIDEDHGDEFGNAYDAAYDELIGAAKAFAEQVRKSYHSWACELVKTHEVVADDYLQER